MTLACPRFCRRVPRPGKGSHSRPTDDGVRSRNAACLTPPERCLHPTIAPRRYRAAAGIRSGAARSRGGESYQHAEGSRSDDDRHSVVDVRSRRGRLLQQAVDGDVDDASPRGDVCSDGQQLDDDGQHPPRFDDGEVTPSARGGLVRGGEVSYEAPLPFFHRFRTVRPAAAPADRRPTGTNCRRPSQPEAPGHRSGG